jgi:hypothetical protein
MGLQFVSIASPDVTSVQNILTPFIQFDDASTSRDDENKQQDHFNDHNFGPLGTREQSWSNGHRGQRNHRLNLTRQPYLVEDGAGFRMFDRRGRRESWTRLFGAEHVTAIKKADPDV